MQGETARIRLVVFDWAGTTVDHGCFAPVAPFVDAFAASGVTLTVAEARGPMGLEKKDHVRALFALPAAASQWRAAHGRAPDEADVERVFAAFVPLQLAAVSAASVLIDGLLACVAELRKRGIAIAGTTGYFADAAALCYAAAAKQGYAPDFAVCPAQVAAGRPAPWMIYRCMGGLGVFPPAAVVKVGDTVPDIHEGLSAGAWSVGVTASGSEVGLSADDLAALPADERHRRIAAAGRTLLDAGAHYVIDSVRDLPQLIGEIDDRLRRGESPSPAARRVTA